MRGRHDAGAPDPGRTRLEEHHGFYRLDVTQGPGSGVKILNQPPPAPFKLRSGNAVNG